MLKPPAPRSATNPLDAVAEQIADVVSVYRHRTDALRYILREVQNHLDRIDEVGENHLSARHP